MKPFPILCFWAWLLSPIRKKKLQELINSTNMSLILPTYTCSVAKSNRDVCHFERASTPSASLVVIISIGSQLTLVQLCIFKSRMHSTVV